MEHGRESVFEFGPFRLEPARRLLTTSGDPVPIGDRALDILLLLAERAPNVVTARALLERAWPGVIVEPSNLRVQIASLQKALGDDKDGKRYISNVTGRGYCIVVPVSRSMPGTREEAGLRERYEAGRAPVPASPDTNLPRHHAEIIGREREMAELLEWLGRSRLITLVGPGGVGKSRLAVELGWRALEDFPAGVRLIDLAPVADTDAVASATAAALQVPVAKAEATVETIVATLGKGRRLLIFDNCEHLIGAAAALIRILLDRLPGLSVLATSQRDLHLAAEQVYGLDTLEVPPAGAVEIGGFAAADLFVARAHAADRLFALHDGNSAGVGEICRHLDGLPLALEMAAARLRMFGVEGLRRGLADRLRLLKAAPPDGDERHASLQSVVEWSHGLLAPFDQRVFRRLAIFPGSFSLEAAVAVAREEGAESWDVVDALGRLIDRSLITPERRDPPRYRLLETLRLYAGERLQASGEAETTAERHARHFIEVFDRARLSWEDMLEPDWIALYQPELDNLRAALDWALADQGRRHIAVALAASGNLLLGELFMIAEGRKYLNRIVQLIDRDMPQATAAYILHRAAVFRQIVDDPAARAFAERSVALFRALDDRPNLASALTINAIDLVKESRRDEAKAMLLEAEQLLSGSACRRRRLVLLNTQGSLAVHTNNLAEGRLYFMKAAELAHALKSAREVMPIANIATTEYALGNTERAIEFGRAAVNQARLTPGRRYIGLVLCNLAGYLLCGGRPFEAKPALEEALALLVNQGNYSATECLLPLAVLKAMEGQLTDAAQLAGFFEAERARRGHPLAAPDQPLYDKLSGLLNAGLPPAEIEACKAEAAHWSEAKAVEFAVRRLHASVAAPAIFGEGR